MTESLAPNTTDDIDAVLAATSSASPWEEAVVAAAALAGGGAEQLREDSPDSTSSTAAAIFRRVRPIATTLATKQYPIAQIPHRCRRGQQRRRRRGRAGDP